MKGAARHPNSISREAERTPVESASLRAHMHRVGHASGGTPREREGEEWIDGLLDASSSSVLPAPFRTWPQRSPLVCCLFLG